MTRSLAFPCRSCLLGVLVLLSASSLALAADAAAPKRPPNILLLLTDDHRFDAVHALGNPIVRTLELDRLAEQGTVFTNAFCTTAICAISRASLITGQYARRHGIIAFTTPISAEALAETFPALLRKAGYRTGFVGKWGLGEPMPEDAYDFWRGFPGQGRYFDTESPELHLTDRQGNEAVEFLDGCTAEQPFCLQVSFKAPHCQDGEAWQFPHAARFADLYAEDEIPIPPTANDLAYQKLPEFLRSSEARARWEVRFATPEMYQKSVKDYLRLVTGVDEVVGRIRLRLAELGLADNTVIIFTSDNGYYLGEHGLADKWFMHEESIRVPLVIYDPRRSREQHVPRSQEMALNIDVAPTILALAGVSAPQQMQGVNLTPLVEGQEVRWRNAWFYEHLLEKPGIPKSEGVRTKRWKYVRYLLPEGNYEQLFDLKNDPHEEHDLARDEHQAAQVSAMRHQCDQWVKRAR
jgi:arylsulfatase A-like enzyme